MTTVTEPRYYTVEEVMKLMGVGKTKAYAMIKQVNKELEDKGKIVVRGKVNRDYFDKKI